MRVAIYARVSRDDQTTLNQTRVLTEYAESQGWEYDVFQETESTRNTRPVKAKVLGLLRQGKYDTLLIMKLDRWARSLTELILEIHEIVNKGINVMSYTEHIDLSTPTGRLQFHIIGAFTEFERDLIRERTMAGIERARSQGKRIGRPPKKKR